MNYYQIKTLYIEVTHSCNQHCKHCYLDGGTHNIINEMSCEQIKKIIKDFKDQGGRYIIITGGEPLMRKDIFDILDYIEEMQIPFNFASNSLGFNQERVDRLVSYKYLDMYFTSLLGITADKHMMITERDSFNKVLEVIELLSTHNIKINVQVTLANDYIQDIEEIASLLMKYENTTVKFTPIATMGIKNRNEIEANKKLIVPKERFQEFVDKVDIVKNIYPDRIENCNIMNYQQIESMINNYKDHDLYSLKYGFIAIRPNGDMSFSCNMGNPYTFGKAYESINIPMNNKFNEYLQILREAEEMTLEKSKNEIVEFDVSVDNYICELSKLNLM